MTETGRPRREERKRQGHRGGGRHGPPLLVGLLALASISGGGPLAEEPTDPTDELPVIPDEPFVFEPSVVAELVFDAPGSPVGWGSFDLTAVPEEDEIRVDLLVGRAAERARWRSCSEVELVIDGRTHRAPGEYAGVPMAGGAWDALTAKLTIDHVRQMRRARHVEARVCGERFRIPARERAELDRFVRDFDDIALWVGPSAPTPPPELGDEHEWGPPEVSRKPAPA